MTVLRSHNIDGTTPWGFDRLTRTDFVKDTTVFAHGSGSLALPGFAGYVEDTIAGFNTVSFYYRYVAAFTTNNNFFYILNQNSGFMTFLQAASGVIRLKDAAGANRFITPNILQPGVWYRIEVYVDGVGSASLKVYEGDNTTPLSDSGLTNMNNAASTGTPTLFRIGNISATAQQAYLDSVQVADSSPGPWPAQVAPTGPTFELLNANGTTSPLTLEGMWNGTAVVPLTVT